MRGSRIGAPIGAVVAAGTSVVCMASMGAMIAASTAGATAGMAGMGTVAASTSHVPSITHALRAVGLGALTHVPNAVLQPLLIVLLLVAIGAAVGRARVMHTAPAITLTLLIVMAAAGLYASIYITVSEPGYWVALTVLVLASFLSVWFGRGRGPARAA